MALKTKFINRFNFPTIKSRLFNCNNWTLWIFDWKFSNCILYI